MFNPKLYEDIDGFIYREDFNLSDSLFSKAISSLLKKGIVEFRTDKFGKICYRITPAGMMLSDKILANERESN